MHYTESSGFAFDPEHGNNLEFRFSGPGSIPNSVQQYNVLRGAELAELRRRRERTTGFPLFCKVRCPGSDVNSMFKSRDLDVVTQLSLDSNTTITNEDEAGSECDLGCDSVRLCGGADSPSKGKGRSQARTRKVKSPAKNPRKHQPPRRRPRTERPDANQKCDVLDKLKNLHLEVCAELQTLVQEEEEEPSPSPIASPSPRRPSIRKVTKQRRIHNTKRQEGGSQKVQQVQQVQKPPLGLFPPQFGEEVSYEDYYQPQPKWVDIMPSAIMSQGIKVNVCTCPAATPQSAIKFMEQYCSMEPESLRPFFQEDSDLDHEFADRKGYLRYVEPRPQVDDDFSDDPEIKAHAVDTSQQLAGKPCFIELEKRPHRVSLLRSLSPMRYTSQGSELIQKPAPAPAQDMEVPPLDLLHSRKRPRNSPPKGQTTPAGAKPKANVVRPRWRPVKKAQAVRLPSGGAASLSPVKEPSVTNPAPPSPPSPPQVTSPRRQQKRRKPSPVVVYSKSLEDLKSEKLRIYNKISYTQERVICALDKLQISLLQLPPVPQAKAQEREKRQRNAFEFCVRFARNFLYPLKGMIDDVRLTSVGSFNSAISNEACHRVMCVYGLMLQSVQTYQRQLRYFLLEKVAQKLSALIEMIYTMTNCCLDKNILDRHDPVVESLLERCTRFLSFIEDMQEERFKLARESLRRKHNHPMHPAHQAAQQAASRSHSHNKPSHTPTHTHTHNHSRFHSPRMGPALALAQPRMRLPKQEKLRSHKRYDLKMYLNDLKVYEPRVVPKERPGGPDKVHLRRRRRNQNRNSMTPLDMVAGAPMVELPSDMEGPAVQDEIRTQMQIQADEDSTSSQSQPTAMGHKESPREAMLEAVRRVTCSQLQQVLDPMMRSLSAMLNEKIARMGEN